jgi:hypothetical protein
MTTGRYGWFWTGGICPETIKGVPGDYTVLGGDYATDGTVAAKPMVADTGAFTTTTLVFRVPVHNAEILNAPYAISLHADA